jgi:hypothetical protein
MTISKILDLASEYDQLADSVEGIKGMPTGADPVSQESMQKASAGRAIASHKHHARDAARLTSLANSVTTPAAKARLMAQAQEHTRLAGGVHNVDDGTARAVAVSAYRQARAAMPRCADLHAVGLPGQALRSRPRGTVAKSPWAGAALRGSILMSEQSKLATIECATCSVLLEVYPQDVPDEPSLGWSALDDGHLCQVPPLRRCPHARAEIKLRFPAVDL